MLRASDEGSASAFLPTIAIGSWRRRLEFAFVTFVANARAFRATAQLTRQTTRPTLENVLSGGEGEGELDILAARALRVDPDPTRGFGFDPQPDPAGLDTNPTRILGFSPFFFGCRHIQLQVL